MKSGLGGLAGLFLTIVLYNAYAEGGGYAVRSWFKAKFANRPSDRPVATVRRHRLAGAHP